jgi:hypothetical protein
MSCQEDSNHQEVNFVRDTYGKNYRKWAKGTDLVFRMYENDNVKEIEEITCWQLRIQLVNGRAFDIFPTSLKAFCLKFKKWYQLDHWDLYQQLSIIR